MLLVAEWSDHGFHRNGDPVAWLLFRDFMWQGVSQIVHAFSGTDGVVICFAVVGLLAFYLWRRRA